MRVDLNPVTITGSMEVDDATGRVVATFTVDGAETPQHALCLVGGLIAKAGLTPMGGDQGQPSAPPPGPDSAAQG